MTDTVELLRSPPPHMGQDNWQVLCNRAADEIERLRSERHELRECVDVEQQAHQATMKRLYESIVEIERLRASAEQDDRLRVVCLTLRDEARQEAKRLHAEIERLRALLRHADDVVIWEHTTARSGFQEEIESALGIGDEQSEAETKDQTEWAKPLLCKHGVDTRRLICPSCAVRAYQERL